MFVPRDATETARQGQGIGDIEAMRQMATKAVPEMLRMAPATSTGMSLLDMAVAAADRDYQGAGVAALGAIPFAGALKYVGKAKGAARGMVRGAEALPMDEASRMARATEQGFTRDLYHGTNVSGEFDQLLPSEEGIVGKGIYMTNKADQAGEFAMRRNLADNPTPAPRILPLKAKVQNPVVVESGGDFYDRFGTLGKNDEEIRAALESQGYDGILMPNRSSYRFDPAVGKAVPIDEVQDYVIAFRPEQVRSRFAKFDPANVGKAGLMGALAGTLGMSAANNRNAEEAR
jgi:hypothetical protein